MKKIITIGIIASLLVCILVWHYFKFPSDSQIRQELAGTWNVNLGHNSRSVTVVQPDGSYEAQISGLATDGSVVRFQGVCQIANGTVSMIITNDSRMNLTAPIILHGQITHWDHNKHVVRWDGMPDDSVSERVKS